MSQTALEKRRGIPDIVFLIDSSGSMSTCLSALTSNVSAFVDTLTNADANGGVAIKDWRIRVVGFRDKEADGSQWLLDNPFVTDVSAAKSQLAALKADGGGDEPESMLDALYFLTQWPVAEKGQPASPQGWRHRGDARRVVVIFTDASCKNAFTAADGSKGSYDDILNLCNEARLKLCLFAPETEGYLRLEEINGCEYESLGTLEGAPERLEAYSADQSNFRKVMDQLAKSISVASTSTEL
jgi:hypothetical protein